MTVSDVTHLNNSKKNPRYSIVANMNRKKKKRRMYTREYVQSVRIHFLFWYPKKKVLLLCIQEYVQSFPGPRILLVPLEKFGEFFFFWEIPLPQRKKDLRWCSREYLRSVLVLDIRLVHLRWPPWACGLVRGLSYVRNPRSCIWAQCHMCSNSCICATWLIQWYVHCVDLRAHVAWFVDWVISHSQRSYVWAQWLIYICSNSCKYCSCTLMHICTVTHSLVRNDTLTALTSLSTWPGSWIESCVKDHVYEHRDSFVCATWLTYTCSTSHFYTCNFMCTASFLEHMAEFAGWFMS